MASGQVEHALDETEGSDAAFSDRFLGPGMQDGTNPFASTQELFLEGALRGSDLEGRAAGTGGEGTWRQSGMDAEQRVVPVDADQVTIPARPDAHRLVDQMRRHRVEGAFDLHMAIGVDAPSTALEEGEGFRGERLQGFVIGLEEVRPDLPPGGVEIDSGESQRSSNERRSGKSVVIRSAASGGSPSFRQKRSSNAPGRSFSSTGRMSRARAAIQNRVRGKIDCHHRRQRRSVRTLTPTAPLSTRAFVREGPLSSTENKSTTTAKYTRRPKNRTEGGVTRRRHPSWSQQKLCR